MSLLETAWNSVTEMLHDFAQSLEVAAKMELAFGQGVNVSELQETWVRGEFVLPPIEVVPAAEINGAYGAFARATNKIYLAKEFLSQNAGTPKAISSVILEEIGHSVDYQLNNIDSPGDEGAIFSALVRGDIPNGEVLQKLKSEDDSAIVTLNNQPLQIEQSTDYIDALLWPGEPKWSSNTITYNFMPFLPSIYFDMGLAEELDSFYADLNIPHLDLNLPDPLSFQAFELNQELAAQEALRLWSEVADVNFVQKSDIPLSPNDFLDLGVLEPALEEIGEWSNFTDQLSEYIINLIGTPLVNGADIRFGTANITGSGGSSPPYTDSLTRLNQIRDGIASFIDTFVNPFNIPGLPSGSDIISLPDVKILPFGDVWLNKNYPSNSDSEIREKGKSGFTTILHEIGHALGLKHPGEYDASGVKVEPYLPDAQDNHRYSIMSYNPVDSYWTIDPITNEGVYVYPSTPMLYDIAAIQYLYGANTNIRSDNTSYSWSNSSPVVLTIWDSGGVDTIDASNQTTNSLINLNQGQFSSIGSLFYRLGNDGFLYEEDPSNRSVQNVVIAFNTIIENATGGTGNDFLTGNDEDNNLQGGSGNDTINAGLGNDNVDGGAGDDTINAGLGYDFAYGGEGNDLLIVDYSVNDSGGGMYGYGGQNSYGGQFTRYDGTGQLVDQVNHSGFERFQITGTPYADQISSSDGDDVLIGGGGADSLTGDPGDINNVGSDTYILDATNAAGSLIQDYGETDSLILENAQIALVKAQPGKMGLGRLNTSLIVDLNQDGVLNPSTDLSIVNFYADRFTNTTGFGFLESVGNVSGNSVLGLQLLDSDMVDMGTLSSPQTFNDFVGNSDPEDYYRFHLSADSQVNLTLDLLHNFFMV